MTTAITTTPASAARNQIGGPSNLLRSFSSEWTKLRTIRSPWIVVGVVSLLTMMGSATLTYFSRSTAASTAGLDNWNEVLVPAVNGIQFANYLGVIAVVIVGALIGSGDFQHKTVAPTLVKQPSRWKFLSAKAGFTVAISIALAVFLIAACLAASYVLSPMVGEFEPMMSSGGFHEYVSYGLGAILPIAIGHLVLAGLFGMALGLATRSTTFAVSGFFVLRFIELTISVEGNHWTNNLLPFKAGDRLLPYMVADPDPGKFGSKPASAAIYISVIAVLMAVGVIRTYRQDVG